RRGLLVAATDGAGAAAGKRGDERIRAAGAEVPGLRCSGSPLRRLAEDFRCDATALPVPAAEDLLRPFELRRHRLGNARVPARVHVVDIGHAIGWIAA